MRGSESTKDTTMLSGDELYSDEITSPTERPNTIRLLGRENEYPTKKALDLQIERLIDQALAQKHVTFNRHDVGSFDILAALLPQQLPFDRLGLYDATLLNGNGSAQVRRRKNNIATIVFDVDPDVSIAPEVGE